MRIFGAARPRNGNDKTMKKTSDRKHRRPAPDDMRAEYRFDYREARTSDSAGHFIREILSALLLLSD